MTLAANSGVDELTEQAPLYPAYLTGAVATGTSAGLTARLRARTLACGAYLGACYLYLLFAAQGCLLKGDGDFTAQVGTTPGCLTCSRTGTTKKGFKDVAKAAEIKALEAPPEEIVSTTVSEAVIGSALIGVREHFVSLIYFLELFRSPVLSITVGMIFKRQLTKSLLYLLVSGVSRHTQNLIVITFHCHIVYLSLDVLLNRLKTPNLKFRRHTLNYMILAG